MSKKNILLELKKKKGGLIASEDKENFSSAVSVAFANSLKGLEIIKPSFFGGNKEDQEAKFKKEVFSYIESDEFIGTLGDEVGEPEAEETEEEYLARAKASFMGILGKKLDG